MKYFSLKELTKSDTAKRQGIDNTPSPEHTNNIVELITQCLDPLREAWGSLCKTNNLGDPAIIVTSGYRSPGLNKAIGGSLTSAHSIGAAADIIPANRNLGAFKKFCKNYFRDNTFDQLISEEENHAGVPTWIHIGYKNRSGEQRRQMLSYVQGRYIPITGE